MQRFTNDPKVFLILILLAVSGYLLYQNTTSRVVVPAPDEVLVAEEVIAPDGTPPAPTVTNSGVSKPMPLSPAVSPSSVTTSGTSPLIGKIAPEFTLASGFSNSEPFKMQDIVGKKVILMSFQSYTTKNSLRSEMYLNHWYNRYKNKGLAVIAVHTPRFAFDRSKTFVDQSAFAQQAYHPIVLDNQSGIINSWGAKEWPTHFLVDISGKVVAVYRGEGNYVAIEEKIQGLLSAREKALKLPADFYTLPIEIPAGVSVIDGSKVKSSEVFFGYSRNSTLGNGTALRPGMQDMKPFTSVLSNTLYLGGSWDFTKDYAQSSTEKNTITYRYNAKNVYAVLGSAKMTKVRLSLDGAPLGARAGKDVREEKGVSYMYVSEERIYDIVRGDSYGEHTLEMVVETSGLEAYSLQFE